MKLKLLLFLIPLVSSAQTITSIVDVITDDILSPLIGALFVLATVVFMWGVIQYSLLAESDEKLNTARRQMLWGIIGLAVMSSAWGLVKIICNTFSVSC